MAECKEETENGISPTSHFPAAVPQPPGLPSPTPAPTRQATELPSPTPPAPAPKDNGKGLAIPTTRKSPRLVTESEGREKLMAGAIRAAHAVDIRRRSPEVSPFRRRVKKQFGEEGAGSGSAFSAAEEFSQEDIFASLDIGGRGEDWDISDEGWELFGRDLPSREDQPAIPPPVVVAPPSVPGVSPSGDVASSPAAVSSPPAVVAPSSTSIAPPPVMAGIAAPWRG